MKLSFCAAAAAVVALAATPALAQPADDNTFIQKAVAGDTGEIQMGHMLEQKGGTAQVRHFGATLVQDHTLSRRKAEAAAKAMGASAPEQPDPDAVQAMSQLQSLSGAQLDTQAKQIAIQDHQKDIAMFEQEAKSGHGPAAAHARQSLPVLRKHLHMAEALKG
ncbi:MAG: DUF4142 domain-containing protein [Caulobacteraceae bacterium]|nr:DUF4142 domain-containing protein [Caulobacteraceae bacterium]